MGKKVVALTSCARVPATPRLPGTKKCLWMKRFSLVVVAAILSLCGDGVAGLIGHWAMDDGSGTVAKDSSGGDHHGQLVDGPQWVTGLMRGALELDGVKARVDIPYWPGATPAQGTTMTAWVFPKDTRPRLRCRSVRGLRHGPYDWIAA